MFHQGSMVALITPMLEDGSVDEPSLWVPPENQPH